MNGRFDSRSFDAGDSGGGDFLLCVGRLLVSLFGSGVSGGELLLAMVSFSINDVKRS